MKNVFIDPPSHHFYGDAFFDLGNQALNRDNCLLPYSRLKNAFADQNLPVKTADFLENSDIKGNPYENPEYYSFGPTQNYLSARDQHGAQLKAFVLFEPPVVVPEMYEKLPELTKNFEAVYVHNTEGDGYSLKNVDRNKLRKLYWPQPFEGVLEEHWNKQNRLDRVVVINGNHKPASRQGELYSERIYAMKALHKDRAVDLFGRGWKRWYSGTSRWLPYWLNLPTIQKIYRGSVDSKYETLAKYRYCLCFENMKMKGYMTEKLFDCFYTGTIPIYLGASDIEKYVDPSAFIDARQFKNHKDIWPFLTGLTKAEIERYRQGGRNFMESERGKRFVYSLENDICKPSLENGIKK